ncbi:hypothetical protein CYMTET_3822 [Cymbomonas tetramitiformis]|uniref:Uncharacterized protein n=1 Tax=Cymbomonas tetramitiformis TaxID=36881 RepID=A0AAE0LKZ5_9CHLO|nr:hypothetical protein CYMTET_3822 [Cymbomonas tetramitiformis]
MSFRSSSTLLFVVGLEGCTSTISFSTAATLACVEQLLEEKADVNATDAEGCTPLHWAAMDGQNGVIDCLVWGGADLSAQTQKSSTPQDLAKLSLQNDFLDELLEVVQMKEERDALHKDFGELQHILHQLKVPKEVLTRPEELILRGPVATGNTGYAGYAAQAGQAQGTLLHKRVGDKGMQLLARQLGHNTSMRNLTVACHDVGNVGACVLADALVTNTTLQWWTRPVSSPLLPPRLLLLPPSPAAAATSPAAAVPTPPCCWVLPPPAAVATSPQAAAGTSPAAVATSPAAAATSPAAAKHRLLLLPAPSPAAVATSPAKLSVATSCCCHLPDAAVADSSPAAVATSPAAVASRA